MIGAVPSKVQLEHLWFRKLDDILNLRTAFTYPGLKVEKEEKAFKNVKTDIKVFKSHMSIYKGGEESLSQGLQD